MGTATNCSTCGEICNGANDEICLGADRGCGNACLASTADNGEGHYTTDTPPVFYPSFSVSPMLYTDPTFTTVDVVPCTTSADCTLCSLRVGVDGFGGCGCIQVDCDDDGARADMSGTYDSFGPQGNGYVCAVVIKRRS